MLQIQQSNNITDTTIEYYYRYNNRITLQIQQSNKYYRYNNRIILQIQQSNNLQIQQSNNITDTTIE